MVSLTCGIFKRKKHGNEYIDTQSQLVFTRGKEWKAGKMGECGQKYKLSYKIRPGDVMYRISINS